MNHEITFLRSVLNSMIEGVLVVDQKTMKVLLYNDKFASMWDIDEETMLALDSVLMKDAVLNKVLDPKKFMVRIEEIIKLQEKESTDIIELKDHQYYERRSLILDMGNEQTARLYFFRDVTKEREKIKHNEKMLEDRDVLLLNAAQMSAIGEMAGNIAHEINNPLAIIKMSSKCLKEMLSNPEKLDSEMINRMISAIDNTVDRIAKTVLGLRNISRKTSEEKMVCNLDQIVSDVMGIACEKCKSFGIKIIQTITPEILEQPLYFNRIQISQVLINLLNNSADALEHLEQADRWIEIRAEHRDENLYIYVTDGGKGLAPDIKDKIFTPYFTSKGIGKGTGIGLTISKTLIEKNGGRFYLDENSYNTCFVISLPAPHSVKFEPIRLHIR